MIRICHLYADIMSTYGDRGNVDYLEYFLMNLGLSVTVLDHNYREMIPEAEIYVFGGGQDSAQVLVAHDLQTYHGERLRSLLERSYCLAICGGYQLLGKYYMQLNGQMIDGLGYLPVATVAGAERMSGHVVGMRKFGHRYRSVVGFENHSGRTYILDESKPLMRVVCGGGNNGTDRGEGIVYGKTIGTYLHGPILPRNPHLVYWWLRDMLPREIINRPGLLAEKNAHLSLLAKFGGPSLKLL